MKYIIVCSGIEAATVAWNPLTVPVMAWIGKRIDAVKRSDREN